MNVYYSVWLSGWEIHKVSLISEEYSCTNLHVSYLWTMAVLIIQLEITLYLNDQNLFIIKCFPWENNTGSDLKSQPCLLKWTNFAINIKVIIFQSNIPSASFPNDSSIWYKFLWCMHIYLWQVRVIQLQILTNRIHISDIYVYIFIADQSNKMYKY